MIFKITLNILVILIITIKKTMNKNFFISILLCISITFCGIFFTNIPKANAVPITIADFVPQLATTLTNAAKMITGLGEYVGLIAEWAKAALEWVAKTLASALIVAAKIAALYAIEKAVAYLIGDDGGKEAMVIRDFESYLYTGPKQEALKQMKSFLTEVSASKSSYLNYEGIGTSYVSYLKKQGETAISDTLEGTIGGKKITTDIQEYVSDSSNFFAEGNMKGVVSYMKCANNPACLITEVQSKTAASFNKFQDIARSEAKDGLLPKKSASGRIETPAVMAQNALLEIDKQGTSMIIDAPIDGDTTAKAGALMQIATGAAMSIVSRAANYGIVDEAAKVEAELTTKLGNTYYSFSTSYKSLTK